MKIRKENRCLRRKVSCWVQNQDIEQADLQVPVEHLEECNCSPSAPLEDSCLQIGLANESVTSPVFKNDKKDHQCSDEDKDAVW